MNFLISQLFLRPYALFSSFSVFSETVAADPETPIADLLGFLSLAYFIVVTIMLSEVVSNPILGFLMQPGSRIYAAAVMAGVLFGTRWLSIRFMRSLGGVEAMWVRQATKYGREPSYSSFSTLVILIGPLVFTFAAIIAISFNK